jgi:hypothetical protein
MNATIRFVVWGVMPLGGLVGGALGAAIGVRATLFVAAAGWLLPLVPLWFSPLRHTDDLASAASAGVSVFENA